MSKIFWTDAERASIKAELTRVFSTNLNMSRHLALREAMMALPLSRRRVATHQTAYHEREMIQSALNAARRVVHVEPAPPVNPPLQELVKSELGSALEHLIDLVVDQVLAQVQSRLAIEKASAPPSYDAALARANVALRSAPSTERAPRTGVLICGIQPHQGAALVRDFPNLDITCYDSDEARTKTVIRRAHTFMMTRFLSHQVDERFRGSSPNLHRVPGGYSELRLELKRLSELGVVKC